MDELTENQFECSRFSFNMWTPARCQNSALQDEHGQAFYEFDNATAKAFTPRRSGRLRRVVEYPRDGKVSTPKRRKTKKIVNNVKSEDAPSGSTSSPISTNQPKSPDKHDSTMQEFLILEEAVKKPDSNINFQEDVKFTRAIETIEIFDSPIETVSAKNTPKTVIKCLKPPTLAIPLLASSAQKKITPGKSAYSAYFTDRTQNAGSSIKKPAGTSIKKPPASANKKPASAKADATRKRIILGAVSSAQQLNGNRSPVNNEIIPKPLKRLATPKTRLKLPNFKAIHQNQFDKMISIVDDIAKKQERAAKAFNFAADLKKMQYVDRITPAKSNSSKKISSNTKKQSDSSKSKARKRIEISKIPIFMKNVDDQQQQQPPTKVIEFKETSSKPCAKREDKIGERRKKNMKMYKTGFQRTEKNEIIRGVRSNRRFDLQMQYRDSLK